MKYLFMLFIPLLLFGQSKQDRVVLVIGRSFTGIIKEISDLYVTFSYDGRTHNIGLSGIDSLFKYPGGLIYTAHDGFKIEKDSLSRVPDKIQDKQAIFFQSIQLINGKHYECQLLKVTQEFVIAEVKGNNDKVYYQSFVRDSVLSVATVNGRKLFAENSVKVKNVADYYNAHKKPATKVHSPVSHFPRIGFDVSFGYTFTNIAAIEKYAEKAARIYAEQNDIFEIFDSADIPAQYQNIDVSLQVDFTNKIGLTMLNSFDVNLENGSYKLLAADFRYILDQNRFKPWLSFGYAILNVHFSQELNEDTRYYFNAGMHSFLLGLGFELQLNGIINLSGSYRYIPFSEEDIRFKPALDIKEKLDFRTHHLMLGFTFKF